MFPSFADQEQDCLIIGLDTGLLLDFIKVILGMGGNLDSSLMELSPSVRPDPDQGRDALPESCYRL